MDEWEKYYNKSIEYYQNGEYDEAINYAHKVKEILEIEYQDNLNHPNLVTNYSNLGLFYQHLGKFDEALIYTKKATEARETLYQDNLNNPDLSQSYNNLGSLYQQLGELDEALLYINKAKEIREILYQDNFNHPSLATSYSNLGSIYKQRGEIEEALDYTIKAKEIREIVYQDTPNHLSLMKSYNNLGLFYQQLGKLEKALTYANKAKEIMKIRYQHNPNHPSLATSHNNIGLLHQELGEYDKALIYANKAKKIKEILYKDNPNHPSLATTYNNLGAIYQGLLKFDEALKYAKKVKEIFKVLYKENPNHPSLATSYNNLGTIYKNLGKFNEALEYANKTKNIMEILYKDNPNHPDLATSYNNIGLLYKEQGKFDDALKYANKTINIIKVGYRDNPNHPDLAKSYNNIGLLYEELEELDNFYRYAQKACHIYIENRRKNFSYLSQKRKHTYSESYSYYLKNYFKSSHFYTQEIQKEKDFNRAKEISKNLCSNWFQYKGSISDFENIITILYNGTNNVKIRGMIEAREELKKQLSVLYHRKEEDSKKQDFQRKQSIKIEEEIAEIEHTLTNFSTQLSEESKLENIDTKMLSSILKVGELYIDYVNIGDDYYLFTLNNKEEINFIKFDVQTTKEINNTITSYIQEIERFTIPKQQDKQTTKAILHKLYTLLIEPYKETIFNDDYDNYIISPDGSLGLISYDALYDGEKYLIETKNITYIPSGKELVRIRRNQSNQSDRVTVFANPNFDDNIVSPKDYIDEENSFRSLNSLCDLGDQPFSPLPGTQKELQSIQEIISEEEFTAYSDSSATKENFLKVTDTKILHCATHGFFLNCPDTENPLLKVGIAFSGANIIKEDGTRPHIATGLELASMKLQGTEMVVLSACESAAGEIEHAEGVLGLNKAFIQAGAKTVVANLWKADDKETAEFFKVVYQELDKELDKEYKAKQNNESYTIDYARLIRHTKLEFIKNDKHSVYWSGFVVSG